MNEHFPRPDQELQPGAHRRTPEVDPAPDRLLVPSYVRVSDHDLVVHVPSAYDSAAIAGLESAPKQLGIETSPRLQVFLSLPDTDASAENIVQHFEESFAGEISDINDLIHATIDLDEYEREVTRFVADRFLYFDYINPDYEALGKEVRRIVDVVEKDGKFYALYK